MKSVSENFQQAMILKFKDRSAEAKFELAPAFFAIWHTDNGNDNGKI